MINDFVKNISELLPKDVGSDFKKNLDAAVRSQFEKMNLVSNEQMEIQEKILERAMNRIQELEKRVAELESESRK